jgi:AcrR family transcriptional regulator
VEVIPFSAPERPPSPRKDAQRNRRLIIEAATRALADGQGIVKIETIAKDAGVGVATLYRNFPSREALVEEVYRSELARLCTGVGQLLTDHPPVDAMRTWMSRYQQFVATKRDMAETLRAVIASGAITSGQTREHINSAIGAILEAGTTDGTLRADIKPADVSASLAGIMLAAADEAQATRMLHMLVDAMVAHPSQPR